MSVRNTHTIYSYFIPPRFMSKEIMFLVRGDNFIKQYTMK